MGRYIYSLVRCVPDPRTGEFVNMGAIAGDAETGDWSIRQVSNEQRVRKLAGENEISAVHNFLTRIGSTFDRRSDEGFDIWDVDDQDATSEDLTEQWLEKLHHDLRNVVQLSQPLPIDAESADSALDYVFRRMIIDPTVQQRGFVTKSAITSRLITAYAKTLVARNVVRRPTIFVGGHIEARIDFGVVDRSVLQLTQAWSFQVDRIDVARTQVKAWGYAMRDLRSGSGARLERAGADNLLSVPSDVDLRVVVAPPTTGEQQSAFDEAEEIFSDVGATVVPIDDAEQVADQARILVGAGA